ncbi:MAG: T9SS type A sorting domain-containing protein, partial [Melioribacteraceae bacterium]
YSNLKFHSLVIKQNPNGEKKGQVYFDGIQTEIITNVKKDNLSIPTEFKLEQNYPNPFNPSTTIRYSIPSNEFVTLKIYNILGSEVANLVNKKQTSGSYQVNFDASNITSGIYFYKISTSKFNQVKKMLLVK